MDNVINFLKKKKDEVVKNLTDDKGLYQRGQFTPLRAIPGVNRANTAIKNLAINTAKDLTYNTRQTAKPILDYVDPRGYQAERNSIAQGGNLGQQKMISAAKAMPMTAVNAYALSKVRPAITLTSGLLGGGMNKLSGGSFSEGWQKGVRSTPTIAGITSATRPIIGQFGGALANSKVAKPIVSRFGAEAVNRVAQGVANIPEGMAINRGMGIKSYTPVDAALDFGLGTAGADRMGGKPSVKGAVRKTIDQATLDEVDGLRDYFNQAIKGKATIDNQVKTDVDRIANQWLDKVDIEATLAKSRGKQPAVYYRNLLDKVANKVGEYNSRYEGFQMGIKSFQQPPKPQQINTGAQELDVFYTPKDKSKLSGNQVVDDMMTGSGMLPRGNFYALDKPFSSHYHNSKNAIKTKTKIGRVYDPDGVLGRKTENLSNQFLEYVNKTQPADVRQAYTDFLTRRGYDSYARNIDGQPGNRELIVLNKSINQSKPEKTIKIKPPEINTGAYTAIDPKTGRIRVQDPKQTLRTLMGGTTDPKMSNAQTRATMGIPETDPFIRDLERYQTRSTGVMPPSGGGNPPRPPKSKPGFSKPNNKPVLDYDTAIQKWRGLDLASQEKANAEMGRFKNIPEDKGMDFIEAVESGKKGGDYDRLRKTYNDLREEALAAGLDVKYVDDYINHKWVETPKQIEQMFKDIEAKGIGKVPSFVRERRIPTYREGIDAGLTPKYTHPDQLIAEYRRQLERSIAAKELSDNLYRSGQIKDTPELGWKPIDAPLIPDLHGKFAEPRIAAELSNIFGQPDKNWLNTGLEKTAGFSKGMQDVTLSGGIKTLNSFSLGNLIKEYTAGRIVGPTKAFVTSFNEKASNKYFQNNQKELIELAEGGIPISTSNDYTKAYKNLFEGDKSLKDVFGKQWNSWIEEPTFKRFLPMLQVEFYKDAKRSGMSQEQAIQATKNFYGVIDNFRNPKYVEDFKSTLFFAPKFRQAMVDFWRKNANSIGIEGGISRKGRLRINTKNLTDPAFSANRKFLGGMVLTYLMYQAANKAITGHWMHENKEGKEFAIEIPVGNGRSWYIPMLPTIATIPRRVQEMGSELLSGDIGGAGQKAGSFFSQPISLGSQLLSNKTFYGGNIYEEDDPALAKVGKTIGYGLGQSTHPFIGEPIDVLQGRKTPLEGVMGALELPIYPSKSSGVDHLWGNTLKKYQELLKTNPQEAEAYRLETLAEANKPKESEYVTEDDSPKNGIQKALTYGESAVFNPVQTYEALSNGEPIRKIRRPNGMLGIFDSTTVTERKKDTSELDAGDISTQVDHKMPKWLGGRETEDNYQRLTNEEHKYKSAEEKKIRDKYEAGKMSRNEAIKQVEALNKKLNPIDFPEVIKVTSTTSDGKKKTKKIKVQEVVDMPDETPSQQKIKMNEAYKLVSDIAESKMSSNEKANLWKVLGLDEQDVRYYLKANNTNADKYAIVTDELSKLKSKEDILAYLEAGRAKVNGKNIASDGVLDYLYEDGVITDAERKYLKKIDYEYDSKTGTYKKKSSKGKSLKIGTTPKYSAPKISLNTTPINVNIPSQSLKIARLSGGNTPSTVNLKSGRNVINTGRLKIRG